jgi:type III secretory pathway component EscV
LAGGAILSGKTWGRVVGVLLAGVSAIVNFAFIPVYPFWSIIIIAICVFVIYALTVHGNEISEE